MSARANPMRIGIFVVGAVVLIIAGLLAFGSRDIFTERQKFIAFFEGSVAGLRVGAPVTFRGVPVGEVTDIRLIYDSDDGKTLLPVIFETFPDSIDVVDTEFSPRDRCGTINRAWPARAARARQSGHGPTRRRACVPPRHGTQKSSAHPAPIRRSPRSPPNSRCLKARWRRSSARPRPMMASRA